ncbi:hypothetical protein A2U01_0068777, partial [Trifolium medium]|nr:hypothetical protein [Trifolium medium]
YQFESVVVPVTALKQFSVSVVVSVAFSLTLRFTQFASTSEALTHRIILSFK